MNETYFYRDKKDTNYTILNNTFIRDERLSWKAKGLMTYLLSLPEDWKIYLKEVEKHASDGRDSLRSALKPLIKYGYIVFEQKRTEKGNFGDCIYKIIENPKAPQTEKPYTENPTAEKPNTENPHLLNTNNTKYLCKLNTDNDISNNSLRASVSADKKEPRNDIERIEKIYFDNWNTLYKKGVVKTEKPSFNYGQCRKRLRNAIDKYSENVIAKAMKKSIDDDFVVSKGYGLNIILSDSILNSLINSNEYGKKKNAMYEQDHPDDVGEILF